MTDLVLRIDQVSAVNVDIAGGKGANLGELARADFSVPDGFILTTDAYALAARLARVDPREPTSAAGRLRTLDMPDAIGSRTREAYAALGGGPVAVRSSATAEDLPGASFAGQQDTYLNVVGDEALLDAIRGCWASLWNGRAVAYRRAHGVEDGGVRPTVVVQRMVDASAAGVLFTADPLTGRRRRGVIEAIADLGEKLVSGAVDPDHYTVDTAACEIVERRPAGNEAVLSDDELLALAALGDRVERHFCAPQDIEFAIDGERHLWLVQSRPITTLYPLPADTPDPQREVRVYFSGNVFQGYFEPLTPMGIQFFRSMGTAVWRTFGRVVDDALPGPKAIEDAGMRIYIDVTPVVRDPVGRGAFESITALGEARSSVVLSRLASDPRLALVSRWRVLALWRIAMGLMRVGVPLAALRMLSSPFATRARFVREMDDIARVSLPTGANATLRLDAFERLMLAATPHLLPRLLGMMAPTLLSLGLAARLLRGWARDDELQTITRSAPHNPTTEMDLALWSLSIELRADRDSHTALLERAPADLAAAYRAETLPRQLQGGLYAFLARYGFRAIGEIDIGVARWSEDPTHILGALGNYARLGDDALAPDTHFANGERAAEAMVASLLTRVHGPRRTVLRFLLRRVRVLVGSREAPKFHIIRLLATPARELLKPVGADLTDHGRIDEPDDIFFLTLPEARRAVAGENVHKIVAMRRQTFERERLRRHIPRVLLSDGTDAEAALVSVSGGLRGSPASPGLVTGVARVVRSPHGARLEPGEILVAQSTDPGWTPLFLTAGGLVMEMGGMLSHGAVVAREYGIPAVVGVAGATDSIATGQRVMVDGLLGRSRSTSRPACRRSDGQSEP
ncbi:MAG: PEP/pyruvate-binding domain-containing protein [Chloroflexota bacterium]